MRRENPRERVRERAPDLMIDGEMHGAALVESIVTVCRIAR